MSDSREEILGRIRVALDDALLPDARENHPVNNVPPASGGLNDFVREVEALSGQVLSAANAAEAAQQAADLCIQNGWTQALSWSPEEIGVEGLDQALIDANVTLFAQGDPGALKEIPVGITGAEAGLADTGTIVVQSGAGKSSLASLLPPVHIALLRADAIYPDMLAYWESTGDAAQHVRRTSNHVFISGPSRTADIEQRLTLGVHGPRELYVIVWG